jgi:hypothetical protein
VTDRDRAPQREFSAEAVGTLVWLWDSNCLDRRRYRVANRLRSVSSSDHFASLPEDLRERIRQIVSEAER